MILPPKASTNAKARRVARDCSEEVRVRSNLTLPPRYLYDALDDGTDLDFTVSPKSPRFQEDPARREGFALRSISAFGADCIFACCTAHPDLGGPRTAISPLPDRLTQIARGKFQKPRSRRFRAAR
jgi:hypothetical protein